MRVEQIKYGDWVLVDNRLHRIDEIQIDCDETPFVKYPYAEARCAPIPLTPEILQKNNWMKNAIAEEWIKMSFPIILERWTKKTDDSVWWSARVGVQCICDFQYVHEFQHLLWALGKDDNLRI